MKSHSRVKMLPLVKKNEKFALLNKNSKQIFILFKLIFHIFGVRSLQKRKRFLSFGENLQVNKVQIFRFFLIAAVFYLFWNEISLQEILRGKI